MACFMPVCLVKFRDAFYDGADFPVEVFMEFLVRSFYIAGFYMVQPSDELILHVYYFFYQFIKFLFIFFFREDCFADEAFGKQFADDVIDLLFQVSFACHSCCFFEVFGKGKKFI